MWLCNDCGERVDEYTLGLYSRAKFASDGEGVDRSPELENFVLKIA